MAELSSNITGGNGVETENEKVTIIMRTAKKGTKIYKIRTGPLFFSLNHKMDGFLE